MAVESTWSEQHYEAADKWWPWQMKVICPKLIVTSFRSGLDENRVREMLVQLSQDAISGDGAPFQKLGRWSHSAAKWSVDEKALARQLLQHSREFGLSEFCTFVSISCPVTTNPQSPWQQSLINPSRPCDGIRWLLKAIEPVLWEIPENERRHCRDDFQPFFIAPIDGAPIAVHTPCGARQTGISSALAWRGLVCIRLIDVAYRKHSDVIQPRWKHDGVDPVRRFLDDQRQMTLEAAIRFLATSEEHACYLDIVAQGDSCTFERMGASTSQIPPKTFRLACKILEAGEEGLNLGAFATAAEECGIEMTGSNAKAVHITKLRDLLRVIGVTIPDDVRSTKRYRFAAI